MNRTAVVVVVVAVLAGVALFGLGTLGSAPEPPPAEKSDPAAELKKEAKSARVTALGRIEPKDGIYQLAGPSESTVVIEKLLVDKGDPVEVDQVIAILDTHAELEAEVERLEVELKQAEREFGRYEKLLNEHIAAPSARDEWWMKAESLRAELVRARAALEKATVRSPIRGRVIDVHARAGEKVGADGIAEVGRTGEMYAIAEVYETDIGRVKVGQRAEVRSAALAEPVEGTVERIGQKIGKLDTIDADPVAKIDARVVEVEVKLDDSERVAGLTNLQVEVVIAP